MSKIKCSYADQYQATRAPTCGCEVCGLKWELAQAHGKPEMSLATLERVIYDALIYKTRILAAKAAAVSVYRELSAQQAKPLLCLGVIKLAELRFFSDNLHACEEWAATIGGKVHKILDGGPI